MKRDPATGAPDFYRFARDYLPTVARRSPNTIEAYRISLECFLHYLAEHEHIDRADVSFDYRRSRNSAVRLQRHPQSSPTGLRPDH
jgi:site-specific recombinase XerD